MNRLLCTLLSLMLFSVLQHQAEGSTAMQRENVINFLKGKSHPLVRPDGEGGEGTPVMVDFAYSHIRLLDLDVEHGTLKTTAFVFMMWTDRRLRYQRMSSYRGYRFNVSDVRMDPKRMWTPDIEVYNTGCPSMHSLLSTNLAVVFQSGRVYWIPPVTSETFCEPQTDDHHITCKIILGSWTHSGSHVDLQVKPNVELEDSSLPGPWSLTSSSVTRVAKHYDCCPEDYITAEYTFNFTKQD